MTLFPSAFRADRLTAMGTPARPGLGLRSLVQHLWSRRRPFATPTLSVVTARANGTHHERPEPRLTWTDHRTPPDGDFVASAIVNDELADAGVPCRGCSWDTVSEFALSYDGYRYWDDLPELASRVLQRWTRSRSLPATLDELRGCLFYEQRRWHHFGEEPTGRFAQYMWAMVDAIGSLVTPVAPLAPPSPAAASMSPVPDPRPHRSPETHVKLVETRPPALARVGARAMTLRPVPTTVGRLVPVAAAEAHVRLVSAIEAEVGSVSRHPSGRASRRSAGHPSDHPSTSATIRDLRPMPSAEPLPKPPVIERRSRPTSGPPNRPGGAVNAIRTPRDAHPSNGARWNLDTARGPSTSAPAGVTPLCHEFCRDDSGYLTWVDIHPEGFVLNQPRAARSKRPTLHRVGCAAVARRDGTQSLTAGSVKVCGPSADALRAWSLARGTGQPTACRRCCP